jgi:glucose-1-phosphate adenylyltransferase
VRIERGALVEGAVLLDGVRIGTGAVVRNAILDKNVDIAAGARIGVDTASDAARFTVSRGGVVVIGKGQSVAF